MIELPDLSGGQVLYQKSICETCRAYHITDVVDSVRLERFTLRWILRVFTNRSANPRLDRCIRAIT